MDSRFKARCKRPALNAASVEELALSYVGKYATTRAMLRAYLARKIKERGWEGDRAPDLEALADRFAKLGYIDDAAYAMARSRALSGRGYGKRRVTDALRLAGIEQPDSADARAYADSESVAAALRFAERKRVGPFAEAPADRVQREKWIAAMVRAGHGFALSRAIASLESGTEIDLDQLNERTRLTDT